MAKGEMRLLNKVGYYLVGSLFGCSVLLLLYLYFPSGFRAAILGVPLFLYSHFYGSVTQPPVGPSEVVTGETGGQQPETASAPVKDVTDAGAKKSRVAVQADVGKVEAPSVAPANDQPAEARNFSPGAMAMAAAMKSRAGQKTSGAKEFLVLYGSQTGNAMEIAKSISAEAVAQGIASKAVAMSESSLVKLQSVRVALFVVSSTGDGDPPENAESMYNAVRRKTHAPDMLAGLRYSVLGLGDSNFTRYMHVPRAFTSRLPDMGATCFYKCCEADEVEGLEDIVEVWQAGLWGPLKAAVEAAPAGNTVPSTSAINAAKSAEAVEEEEAKLVGVPALQPCRVKLVWLGAHQMPAGRVGDQKTAGAENGEYNHANPLWAPVTEAKFLTAEWSDREVIHMEVDISDSGMAFEAGDSIGVVPQNSPEMVEKLLRRLGVEGNASFRVEGLEGGAVLGHIKQPCTIEQAFRQYVDVTAVPKKGLLRVLGEYCSNSKEQKQLFHLASRGGKEAYKAEIQDGRPGLVDLLDRFPSCKPELAHLVDTLPPLVPRFYSITNSPAANPNRIQVAFSVVKAESAPGRIFKGVATTWLRQTLSIGPSRRRGAEAALVKIPMYHKAGGDFKPPPLDAPVIMIGPGTGVAPFRGFLQDRRARLAAESGGRGAESWLFFGCRKEEEDFLYREELEGFVKEETLSHLVAAFSRAQEQKVYVQDKLREHGAALGQLLMAPNAYVYVCGDGGHMAKDVHAALVSICAEHMGKKESLAIAHLSAMMTQKRYIRDIWS